MPKDALVSRGRYLCVDPSHPDVVEFRPQAGAWEEVAIEKAGTGFSAKFVAANVYFCLTPNGDYQTRKAVGGWETLQIAEQPADWKTSLAFRVEDGKVIDVLQVETR